MLGQGQQLAVDSAHQKKSVLAAVWHKYVHLGPESIAQNPAHLFVFANQLVSLSRRSASKGCGSSWATALLHQPIVYVCFWVFLLPSSLADSKSCTSEYCVHCPTAAWSAALKLIPRHAPGSFATLKATQVPIQAAKLSALSVDMMLPM